MVRDVREPNLLSIWKTALETLRLADEWIIIGYSFPTEDIAIKSMLLRAFNGRPADKRPTVRVIQRDTDPIVEARYRFFFPECRFEYGGVERFIAELPTS